MHASQAVAVEVFGLLAQVTRRSTLSSVIRTFFYTHGMDLLLACVARRPPGSVAPVLEAVLGVEAIWERQQRRFFDVGDRVQLERPQGSGTWLPGAVAKAGLDRTQVLLDPPPPSAEEAARDAACGDGHGACGALHPSLRNQETVEVRPLPPAPPARRRHRTPPPARRSLRRAMSAHGGRHRCTRCACAGAAPRCPRHARGTRRYSLRRKPWSSRRPSRPSSAASSRRAPRARTRPRVAGCAREQERGRRGAAAGGQAVDWWGGAVAAG